MQIENENITWRTSFLDSYLLASFPYPICILTLEVNFLFAMIRSLYKESQLSSRTFSCVRFLSSSIFPYQLGVPRPFLVCFA